MSASCESACSWRLRPRRLVMEALDADLVGELVAVAVDQLYVVSVVIAPRRPVLPALRARSWHLGERRVNAASHPDVQFVGLVAGVLENGERFAFLAAETIADIIRQDEPVVKRAVADQRTVTHFRTNHICAACVGVVRAAGPLPVLDQGGAACETGQ